MSDLALSNLALRLVAVGIPPIVFGDRLALQILLVKVGAIISLVMLSCPPKSRQCVTTVALAFCGMSCLGCCTPSFCCGDENVGVSDGFQVSLVVLPTSGDDAKVNSKHSRNGSSFQYL